MNRRRHPTRTNTPYWRLCRGTLFLLLLLAGCTVGPDFIRPTQPASDRYTLSDPANIGTEAGNPEQVIYRGAPMPPAWWRTFGSPALNALVTQAVASSPTLESAQATVAQANALVRAARGDAYPQVNATASAARLHDTSGTASHFELGAEVGFNPDLFGGTRRRVEQAQAQADYQYAQWQSAYLDLTGSTVLQSIALATALEQIAAVEDIIRVDENNLALVRISADAGKSAQLDVLTAESQLADDRALLPPLMQQASVARHALVVLAGQTAATWTPPEFMLDMFSLPQELPLILPSGLVRQQPAILAAEAQLHAANASIGVATAQMYPDINLSASWAATADQAADIFGGGSNVWNVAANLLAPMFRGGTLTAQRDAAIHAYAAQLGQYRQTVLQTFGNVANALDSLSHDAAQLEAQRRALQTTQATLELTQESYQAGQASLLQLLVAQRLYQQARLGYARARGQRFSGTAQLFIATGGSRGMLDAVSGK